MSGIHTPTPWSFQKHGRHSEYFGNIIGSYGVNERGVAQIRTITCQLNYGTEEENQANAEFIVLAVNSYASSQAEIERLREALEGVLRLAEARLSSSNFQLNAIADHARAALSGSKE